METREEKIKYLFHGKHPQKFYYVGPKFTGGLVPIYTGDLKIYEIEVQGTRITGTLDDGEIEVLYNGSSYNINTIWTSIDSAIFQYTLNLKVVHNYQVEQLNQSLRFDLNKVSEMCKENNYEIGERVDNYIKTGVF